MRDDDRRRDEALVDALQGVAEELEGDGEGKAASAVWAKVRQVASEAGIEATIRWPDGELRPIE